MEAGQASLLPLENSHFVCKRLGANLLLAEEGQTARGDQGLETFRNSKP